MASTNFINECKNRANANRLGKIIIDGITSPITNSDNLQSFEIDSGCYVDGNIIGSVYAKCLKANFIADQNNLTDKSIQTQIGVKYADLSTEYINMGKYTIERPNNEITANYSQITAYDDLYTKLDSKYVCNIDYSSGDKTVSDLYIDVCNQLGLTPKTTEFINSTIPITDNPFTNGESNRTVLQTICKISCSFIDNDTNEIDLCWLSSSAEPDYIFQKNDYSSVEGGQVVCGPINCLIIKNSQIDDENVTIKDEESIAENGEHSITISEDYILYNAELRQQAITSIWNRVKGMKYVDCKLTTYYGKPFLKLGDYIRIYTSDTEYFDTYVLKHNFTYDGSFASIIESPVLTEQEIKAKQNISLGEALRNTQIIVDKQLGKITSTVDEMNTKVEDITATTQTSSGENNLYLEKSLESNALEYSIDGKCLQKTRSGKNLLDMSTVTNSQGIISKLNNDGSVMISGTASSNWSNITTKNSRKISTGTYTLSTIDTKDYNIALRVYYEDNTYTNFNIGAGSKNQQITLSKEVVGYYIYIWGLTANTLYDDTLYLQLEKGSNTTEWEQYGTSPSPDYPSEIKTIKGDENGKLKVRVTGKNLANIDNFQVSGGGVSNPYNQEITNFKDNTPYILSFTKSRINGVTISNNALFTYHSISYYNETALISSEQNTNAITLSDGSIDVNIPIITPVGCNKIVISFANWNGDTNINTLVSNVQFEQDTEITDYEQYKEKEVLIDLAKNNLFDKNNANILNVVVSGSALIDSINSSTLYIECEPNTTYTVSRNKIGKRFRVAESSTLPVIGGAVSNPVPSNYINEFDKLTITTSATAKYLLVFYSNIGGTNLENNNGYTEKELRDSIKVYKGTNPNDSYELNSINDTKDKLEIVNGVADIQKKIGKIVLNGSEEVIIYATASSGNGFYIKVPDIWYGGTSSEKRGTLLSNKFLEKSRNEIYLGNNGISYNSNQNYVIMYYDSCKSMTTTQFKSWLQANPVTVYYELATSETIVLPNINIPLCEGVNHVTLVEDLETTTSIKYLRKTPISGEYALNQDLNETNSNLADTNNQLNQAQNDINSTNTNLNNNYYNKEQVDSINSTTTKNITQIRNTMEQNITSTNATISKIQEEITNGISKVTTTTGTFDENGLNISKSGQQMSSTLDWDGFEVIRDKGKSTEAEVLTVRSAGVEAENIKVRTYFTQEPIRNEKCVSITDSESVGYGTYWIGEE